VSPTKTDVPIEVRFVVTWARMGPRNHVSHWSSDPPREGALLGEILGPVQACQLIYSKVFTGGQQ